MGNSDKQLYYTAIPLASDSQGTPLYDTVHFVISNSSSQPKVTTTSILIDIQKNIPESPNFYVLLRIERHGKRKKSDLILCANWSVLECGAAATAVPGKQVTTTNSVTNRSQRLSGSILLLDLIASQHRGDEPNRCDEYHRLVLL